MALVLLLCTSVLYFRCVTFAIFMIIVIEKHQLRYTRNHIDFHLNTHRCPRTAYTRSHTLNNFTNKEWKEIHLSLLPVDHYKYQTFIFLITILSRSLYYMRNGTKTIRINTKNVPRYSMMKAQKLNLHILIHIKMY